MCSVSLSPFLCCCEVTLVFLTVSTGTARGETWAHVPHYGWNTISNYSDWCINNTVIISFLLYSLISKVFHWCIFYISAILKWYFLLACGRCGPGWSPGSASDCGGTSISNVIFCSHSKMLAMPDCKCLIPLCLILTKSFSVLRCTASCTCLWNILQTDKLTVVAKHVLTLFKMFVNMPKKSCWGSSFSGNNELLLEK